MHRASVPVHSAPVFAPGELEGRPGRAPFLLRLTRDYPSQSNAFVNVEGASDDRQPHLALVEIHGQLGAGRMV